ncbi:MAG: hypothetical protein DRJ11_06915 [Candidatus Aminicenantes bacterium]|nr:MAG: hypothetical protein DRJ11_06915 [Candidatus Aminicenantes bacterium]
MGKKRIKEVKERGKELSPRDKSLKYSLHESEQMLVEVNNKIKKNLWGLGQNKQKMAKLAELSLEKIGNIKELFQLKQKLEEVIATQHKKVASSELPDFQEQEEHQKLLHFLKNQEEKLSQLIHQLQQLSVSPPTPRQKSTAPPPATSAKKKTTRPKILIIEDESIIIKSVSYFLINAGYEVIFALSPQEGLRKAFQEQPDLILLDIVMPGLNGYQVLDQLKKEARTAKIPVIILSALSREADILEGLDRGATDYLTKPFSPEILLSKIKKVLSSENDDSNLHHSL